MKIIFALAGKLAILIPTWEFLCYLDGVTYDKDYPYTDGDFDPNLLVAYLVHLADKDLPTGTNYEIVDDSTIPEDREFRDAWEYVSGPNEKESAELSDEFKEIYNAN